MLPIPTPFQGVRTPPKALPEDPKERLNAIITFLHTRSPNQVLNAQLEVVQKPSRFPFCGNNVRVSEVVEGLLKYCTLHKESIGEQPALWGNIQMGVLQKLNEKTKKKYAAAITKISDALAELENGPPPQIVTPMNGVIFDPLPESVLQSVKNALANPWNYRLEFTKSGDKRNRLRLLSIENFSKGLTQYFRPPYSFDIGYKGNRLDYCILLSKKRTKSGAFTQPRICWDFVSGQPLIRKTKGICAAARPIIQQIAQKKFSGVIPIPVIVEGDKWRMYEKSCPRDLSQLYREYPLQGLEKKNIANSIVFILSELHKQHYDLPGGTTCPAFHGDIKPENILHTPENHLVFTDFGSTAPNTTGGTYNYASPQVLHTHNEGLKGKSCPLNPQWRQAHDVWSIGIILLQLLSGKNSKGLPCMEKVIMPLWQRQSLVSITILQEEVDKDLQTEKVSCLPEYLYIWDCMEKMLRVNPQERISAYDAGLLLLKGANSQ